jgi:hypothetical protein
MRLFTSALCATVAVGLLAGCSGNSLSTPSSSGLGAQANHIVNGHFQPGFSKIANLIPVELAPSGPRAVLDRVTPDKKKKKKGGAYGSQFYAGKINGYEGNLKSNPSPSCTETASYPNGIAVDGKGALIDPDGGTRTVIVYKAGMCGAEAGSFSDDYGQPSDASSPNAASGTIAVGNIFDTSGAGSISVCTMSGCTANLTNSNMYEVAGVAMDKAGNCYASATNSLGSATMTYFKGCAGSGTAATGWENTYYGGLDIDKKGNIVAIDAFTPAVRIYKGCNPTCTLVAGPFTLHGDSVFGHLNKKSTEFIAGDYANGEIDVYKYSTKGLTYEYSFNNGLSVSDDVEGAAFDPRSKQ